MPWLPEPTERLQPYYASADDAEIDHETTLIEDAGPVTLEQIQATCRKYGVRARVVRNGTLIGEVAASGEFVAA